MKPIPLHVSERCLSQTSRTAVTFRSHIVTICDFKGVKFLPDLRGLLVAERVLRPGPASGSGDEYGDVVVVVRIAQCVQEPVAGFFRGSV
ncbi:hypothetical protein ACFRFU_54095, partial [Streptomyces sp. NPDC056704]|uniref:hypothetical protein n=1 Tax=Streptomyces sp. NPDC056704 TaxID=3345917 RepID=UPI0036BB0FD8